ncbi:MAG: sensor histidine kinase [Nocardioidaceae bacterium]
MDARGLDRLALGAGLLAWLAVGVPMALTQSSHDPPELVGPPWVWWTVFLAYGAVFLAAGRVWPEEPRTVELSSLTLQVLLGLAAFALAPDWGFTSVLLVTSAATAAYVLPVRLSLGLVVVQTGWAVAVMTPRMTGGDVFTTAAVFAAFQVFAVIMVETSLRAARTAEALAVANAELEAAQALLAESSRWAERLRIARELHDLVGHQLTGLTLELEVAAHHAEGPSAEHVERARGTAKDLLGDVREAVSQLREPVADVAAELRRLSARVPKPVVHLSLPSDLTVADPEQAHTLVRCVQEVITNTVRHAAADNLWIDVSSGEDGVSVQARDDGRGGSDVLPGNGLAGMRERFEALGGRVAYVTGPGEGFQLSAVLPR